MAEKTNEHNDQAEQLKQIFNELQQNAVKSEKNTNDEQYTAEHAIPKIDVLNLPPRKEVHSNQSRTRLSISRPFLRFLSVILLIIIIIFGAYYIWGEELIDLLKSLR